MLFGLRERSVFVAIKTTEMTMHDKLLFEKEGRGGYRGQSHCEKPSIGRETVRAQRESSLSTG